MCPALGTGWKVLSYIVGPLSMVAAPQAMPVLSCAPALWIRTACREQRDQAAHAYLVERSAVGTLQFLTVVSQKVQLDRMHPGLV
jgi:hypothetical protein